MWRHIERIRKKPKQIRNLYAFWGAAIFTAIVVAIWSVSLPQRLLSIMQPTEEVDRPSGRLWSGVVEYGAGLRANLMDTVGNEEKEANSATTKPDEYAIDLSSLKQSTTTNNEKEGVWQRTYEPRLGGQSILISTTSSSSTTKEIQ